MKVYLKPERAVNRLASREPETQAALKQAAAEIAAKARANLAAHRETGRHVITTTKGVVDHYINLEGPSAVSVEFGHHDKRTGKWVEGIRVLRDAL